MEILGDLVGGTMKKLLSMIFGLMFLGAFLFPAINAGNLTLRGIAANGWYSFDYDNGKDVVLLVDYTKGSETQLNIEIGYTFTPWTSKTVMLSERGSDDVAGNVKLVMSASATRIFYFETIQQKGTILFRVYSTGSLSGTVNLGAELR
jgi:hypothetical protein